VSVSD
jgi:hypothetical protein